MSVMDKFLSAMKLSSDDDNGYYDAEDDGYYDSPNVEPIRKPMAVSNDDSYDNSDKPVKSAPRVINSPKKRSVGAPSDMEVCVIKPTSVEEAREITETLLANRTVVLNLEGIDVDVAQRIIDFTSGSCYAISGNLQKISRYIFIVTPKSVDISGDFQEMISGGAFEGSAVSGGPQTL